MPSELHANYVSRRVYVMRYFLGSIVAFSMLACSSGSPNPTPGPNPNPMPTQQPAQKVYPDVTYPTDNLGFGAGQTLADHTFDAFLPSAPMGQTAKISLHDFYDPDGSRGINAIIVITSAEWCGACMAEASTLQGKIQQTWGSQGVQVIEFMLEDTQMRRTPDMVQAAADRWRARFNLTDMIVGIDPSFYFATGVSGTIGLPLNDVVDPRTMNVVARTNGYGPQEDTQIASLVAKNKIQ